MVPSPSSTQHTDITARAASSASLVPLSPASFSTRARNSGERHAHRRLRRVPALVEDPPDQQWQLRCDMCRDIGLQPVAEGVEHCSEHVIGLVHVVELVSLGHLVEPLVGLSNGAIDDVELIHAASVRL